MADPERRFFFLHAMRTGGTTFVWHLKANFGPTHVFPTPEDAPGDHVSVTSVEYLRSVPRERWDDFTAVTGHFPYFVLELLPHRYEKLTILREPVARTASFLQQWQRVPGAWQGLPLEQIYDDPQIIPHYRNHMTKLFGLTVDAGHYAVRVDVDDAFMARAKTNLESMDVIGFTENHGDFIDQVVARYGLRRPSMPDQHVTDGEPLPASLLERIRRDNAADIELYEHAQALVANRRGSS
ncbi:MAG: hypothetical protein OES57_10085 [Acidimicrobiia bacterium]|nr:hypothetical protein [Acidimicrobiia bacterium]